jgi:hypothetical protein
MDNNNNKIKNNENNNSNNIFGNSSISIFLILATSIFVISYILYNYGFTSSSIKNSSTFYDKDLLTFRPIFDIETNSLDDCIERCDNDIYCAGITYNKDNNKCIGTKEGTLRQDDNNYVAYIKKKKSDDRDNMLFGLTKTKLVIPNEDLIRPKFVSQFSFMFWLNIYDWYQNFENWKHVFHKGSNIDYLINFKNWDDIETNYPDQSPGVWLAPYTNNLRICFTTENIDVKNNKYTDAHVQVCVNKENYDTKNTNLTPTNCYISDSSDKYRNEKNLEDFKKSEGACRDNLSKYPNFTEYIDTYASCKAKCSEDLLCQGFSMHKFKNECQLFSKNGKKTGTDMNTIITGGTREVFNGDKYTCYKKINYVDPAQNRNKLEYIDIKNAPINKPFHIGIVCKYNYVEIYINGKLVKSQNLKGNILFNNGNLHVMEPKTFNGSIYNMNYIPFYSKKNIINKYFEEKPKL